MHKLILSFILCQSASFTFSQNKTEVIEKQLNKISIKIDSLDLLKKNLYATKENLKFDWIKEKSIEVGFPNNGKKEKIVMHLSYSLSYNEEHEQANWVMHIITPDVITGNTTRTNDFREDPMIETGSSTEKDFMLKTIKSDSSGYNYDGFGFDRGHLAPSADFRWSQRALSESYYYSNMSPQLGDFNRDKWADLEDWLRAYVEANKAYLYVVTAPILKEGLPKIERSVNGVSIPEFYIKTAVDLVNKQAIAFIMPNQKISLPVESFAVSIDSVEKILGYDLYAGLIDSLENRIEKSFDLKLWLPKNQKGDVAALEKDQLPKKTINSYDAALHINDKKRQTVCGTAVSIKKSDKGHVFINLDKKFPNQVFSVTIFSSNTSNFSYQPEIYLKDKKVCFTGEIKEHNELPSMIIENEKAVKLLIDFEE